ncbi:tRNA(Ile)-lysidine synthase [Leucobacter exalbidus]|uniref:tRNA(Ile)-lysidine synthase n=1 Tax=Leucobacter exalbidus TaxID=662960 RepID=A0A940PS76_9MICO|nr:tRNA lysidine(34) synthetase TilS [Leucobacter exalbidus]MBP1325782.1 tRNA(Ile)-lysidine synthase [Leucobacter exalbidus]
MSQQRIFGRAVVATRVAARRVLREVAAQHRAARSAQINAAGQPAQTAQPGQSAPAAPPLVLVALSGGADSLALALAVAYEAPNCGVRAGAVVVDHGLQQGSAEVADAAAAQARAAGLDPVLVERVRVGQAPGGPEAQAREARYAAFAGAAELHGAAAILTAHTRGDQAEQVLLGLARGSGLRSLAGIPRQRALANGTQMRRPFLASDPAIDRETTEAACLDQAATFWRDPHNTDPRYARVRVRDRVLPVLETELGPGVAAALARTADLAREDADALDEIAEQLTRRVVTAGDSRDAQVAVAALAGEPAAIVHRVVRIMARDHFGAQLERGHTLAITELITAWRGQSTVYVPGIAVTRRANVLHFHAQIGSPRSISRE